MNCKNCNAVMVPDKEKRVFVCPYCDSTEPFDGMSSQELRDELKGIVSEALRDAGQGTGNQANQGTGHKDTRSGVHKAKDGLISVMQIIFCVFLAFFSVTIFTDDFRIVGFISLAQMILLIVNLVNKSKYHRTGDEKARKRGKICVTTAAILILVWFAALMMEYGGGSSSGLGSSRYKWPQTGIGSQLPVMPGNLEYCSSNKNGFTASSKGNEVSDFAKYVAACKEAGFTIDPEETEDSYLAYDEHDNKLELRFSTYSDRIDVDLDKGIVMTDFQWYTQGIAAELPEPKAKQSYLKTLNNDTYERFEIYVGDMTREEFNAYVNQCMEEGFSGRLADSNTFRGKKERTGSDEKTNGKKSYVNIVLEFQRGRILYIEAYTSEY